MLFHKRRTSQQQADDLAKRYNGRVNPCQISFSASATCRHATVFHHNQLHVTAYFFTTYSLVLVDNFSYPEDICLTIGSPAPSLGVESPLQDAFAAQQMNVFTHIRHDLTATRRFCRKLEQQIELSTLQLRRDENLGISTSQLTLLNIRQEMEILVARIGVLGEIYANFHKDLTIA